MVGTMMLPSPRSDSWTYALGLYVTAMQAANRSKGTIKLHRYYLDKLSRSHRRPWEVALTDLSAMLAAYPSGASKKSARTVYRGFYRWAHGSGLIDVDPATALPPVSVPAGLPRPTPQLVAHRTMRDPDRRIALMAMLAGKLALRAMEIAVVHSDDLADGVLRVHGKGRKLRDIPVMDDELLTLLEEVDGYAFPGRIEGHLSPAVVSRYLSRAMGPNWTGHTLRHRALTEAYSATSDLLAVGLFAGHANTDTTKVYVKVSSAALRAAVRGAAAA